MQTLLKATLALFYFSSPVFALDTTSRLGAEMKAIQSSIGTGILFGWRYLFHTSPYFSVGGAGYTGQLASGQTASYSYGGLIGAFHVPFSQLVSMEVTFLGGGGGGRIGDGTFFGGTVVEPGLGFSFKLGKSVQFVAGGSYVWIPGSAQGSGVSGGVKFEFLSEHKADPVVSRPTNPTPAAAPTAPPVTQSSATPTPAHAGNRATASNRGTPANSAPSSAALLDSQD
jgi:hypothetical protein